MCDSCSLYFSVGGASSDLPESMRQAHEAAGCDGTFIVVSETVSESLGKEVTG
jgi:hypothetical protein